MNQRRVRAHVVHAERTGGTVHAAHPGQAVRPRDGSAPRARHREGRRVTGDDVTAEFIDLQARLGILTDRRDLLRDLQTKATSSSEILRFATLIDQVQLEIENIQGQLKFIHDQVAESTIKVALREKGAPSRGTAAHRRRQPSLGTAFNLALQGFLRVLGAVVVGLGYLIPIGVIALIAWGVVMLVRRRDREAS